MQQYDFIPRNVTRRANLPPANFKQIAIAPWFSSDCTQAYLNSATEGPVSAFIFYKPNNSTNKPQDADSPVWNLGDGGSWRTNSHYPIYAIPGLEGQKIMTQLSLYSGSIDQVPHGLEIMQLYGLHATTLLRVWSSLSVHSSSNLLGVWAFVLIVLGALLLVILAVSITMHFVQRRNRKSLARRVQSGEVDLEAMGIKRVTIPSSHVMQFPLFTYNAEPDLLDLPPTPRSSTTPQGTKKGRKKRRRDQASAASDATGPAATALSVRSIRSKRSTVIGHGDTTATNYQPNCHICLASFEHRVTIIRELPCGHIFHTECIDEFLLLNSSLCPTCKQCMLPRGYSPRITNGMVRRERALRRLRERVDLDELSLESGDTKLKGWGKRLFSSSHLIKPDMPMKPWSSLKHAVDVPKQASNEDEENKSTTPSPDRTSESATPDSRVDTPEVPIAVVKPGPRKSKPRKLKLLPTQPENAVLNTNDTAPNRRGSPSSFARERMRQIADHNAPFDDPDQQRPKCKLFFHFLSWQ